MNKKLLVTSIVVIIVVVAVAVYLATPQPNIQVTNIRAERVFELSLVGQTWQVEFTLVNAGSADGFVDVVLLVDGQQTDVRNRFFIRASSQSDQELSIQLSDFNNHSFDVKILSQSK